MKKPGYDLSISSWYADIQTKGYILKSIPENERTPEMCFVAIHYWGAALEYVPNKYKTYELCLDAVRHNIPVDEGCSALAFVPEELKTYELCLEAVRHDYLVSFFWAHDGWIDDDYAAAINFVPENLKTPELCFEAFINNPYCSPSSYMLGNGLEIISDILKSPELFREELKQVGMPDEYNEDALKYLETIDIDRILNSKKKSATRLLTPTRSSDWKSRKIALINDSSNKISIDTYYAEYKGIDGLGDEIYSEIYTIICYDGKLSWIRGYSAFYVLKNEKIYSINLELMNDCDLYIKIDTVVFENIVVYDNNFDEIVDSYDEKRFYRRNRIYLSEYFCENYRKSALKSVKFIDGLLKIEINNLGFVMLDIENNKVVESKKYLKNLMMKFKIVKYLTNKLNKGKLII